MTEAEPGKEQRTRGKNMINTDKEPGSLNLRKPDYWGSALGRNIQR